MTTEDFIIQCADSLFSIQLEHAIYYLHYDHMVCIDKSDSFILSSITYGLILLTVYNDHGRLEHPYEILITLYCHHSIPQPMTPACL